MHEITTGQDEHAAKVEKIIRSHIAGVSGQYGEPARKFLAFIGDEPIGGTTLETYRDYMIDDMNRKAATVARNMSAIKSTIRDAIDRPEIPIGLKYVIDRELEKVRSPSVASPEPTLLAPEEREIFFTRAKPRPAALARFLYYSACRISEALQIKNVNIMADGKDMFRVQVIGKRRKARKLFIPADVLAEVRIVFGDDKYLFAGWKRAAAGNMIRREALRVLFRDGVSAHSFRHSAATDAVADGIPVAAVSDWLGHSDPSVTAKYYLHNKMTGEYIRKIWHRDSGNVGPATAPAELAGQIRFDGSVAH